MKNNGQVRVAIYARVSSERQAEKELSIPAQIEVPQEIRAQPGMGRGG